MLLHFTLSKHRYIIQCVHWSIKSKGCFTSVPCERYGKLCTYHDIYRSLTDSHISLSTQKYNHTQGGAMFPIEVWITYTLACLVLVISPGPDNILAIGRGLSQGKLAASLSGLASGAGILFHVLTATFGLTLLIQTSELAFIIVKTVGAGYLIWLGIKVLRSRSLINLSPSEKQPLTSIVTTGFLSASLNPKPGMFVLAFIPQFVNPQLGSVTTQMIVYGAWFALLTAIGFALMGIFASKLAGWLNKKPRVVNGLNIGAGLTFITSGFAVAALKQE